MNDDVITIEGGRALRGEVSVHGAKNAVLPILSAALLTPQAVLHGCPFLSDVNVSRRILEHLGCHVASEEDTLVIDASDANGCMVPTELASEMRGSVIFLGALLARFGRAQIALPGGCRLGPRPIDMHISGLRQMGAVITEHEGYLICSVDGRLKGTEIVLRYPSVGATENLLIAAVLAQGETILRGAAKEPEIDALIHFLQKTGAKLHREQDAIYVKGVAALHEVEYRVIPDRIEAATYLCAAAATGGKILVQQVEQSHLKSILPVLEGMGCILKTTNHAVSLQAPERLKPIRYLFTAPYPAFPTDALAPMMIPTLLAEGTSCFEERVFDGRYLHIDQLLSMGALIDLDGSRAKVHGVRSLQGGVLHCTDLRGGAALLLAALAAQGVSTLSALSHIYRGYADLIPVLRSLGARVWYAAGNSGQTQECIFTAGLDAHRIAAV